MPVNIPFDKPVSQELYHGTSDQQLDALTDLLMHYDRFAKRNLSLDAYFKQQPAAEPSVAPPAASIDSSPSEPIPGPTDGPAPTIPGGAGSVTLLDPDRPTVDRTIAVADSD
jgi:hypothetical protein